MDSRVEMLKKRSGYMFGKKQSLDSLHQELALQFFPTRAHFTTTGYVGEEFARNLATSYPILVQRDLSNAIGALMRPRASEWFKATTTRPDKIDHNAKQWLEKATATQRRAMYDAQSGFTRATKEGDQDYSCFGQCAISIEKNMELNALLYRCWHLKDMAWAEDNAGRVCEVHLKWRPTLRDLNKMFPGKLTFNQKERMEKDPYHEVECRRAIIPTDTWDFTGSKKAPQPYMSIVYDLEEGTLFEEVGSWNKVFCIPRFQTISGSQYAYSPATVAGLPDARLLQAMTATLLRAGEKYTDPPMIAVQEAIRGDVALYAGGITWVDQAYDEKMGEVLRPLTQDKSGMSLGLEMMQDTRQMLQQAFYLDKIRPPMLAKEMTAYEYSKLIEGWVVDAAPLFEPTEAEYNGELCDITFDILLRDGAFGALNQIPESLRGQDVQFSFNSPLHDAIEKQKTGKLLEARQLIAAVIESDPSVGYIIDARAAVRDALEAVVPVAWLRSEQQVDDMANQEAQAAQVQQQLANITQGATAAKTLGEAGTALQ